MDKYIQLNYSPDSKSDSVEGSKTPEEVKQYLLSRIDHYLNNFSNQIPQEIIHGPPKNKEGKYYKVQTNWFAGLWPLLEAVEDLEYIPAVFTEDMHAFFDAYKKNHPKAGIRTTKEEIDAADALLRRAKELLEASK